MLDTFLGIGFFISFLGLSYMAYLTFLWIDYKAHNCFVKEYSWTQFCFREFFYHLAFIGNKIATYKKEQKKYNEAVRAKIKKRTK